MSTKTTTEEVSLLMVHSRLRDKTKVLHEHTRFTTFPQTLFLAPLPSQSQPLDSVIFQYSVSYCLSVGTVGYNLCRHQEQIISAKPAPYFGVFNFQIVLPDVSSVGQAPLQSMVTKIAVCSCGILSCGGCLSFSSSSSSSSNISCLLVPRGLQHIF